MYSIAEWALFILCAVTMLTVLVLMGIVFRHKKLVFNALWKTRMVYCAVSFLYMGVLVMPLEGVFQYISRPFCQIHVMLTASALEPLAFMMVLFIVGCDSGDVAKKKSINARIVRRAVMWWVPLLIIQLGLLSLQLFVKNANTMLITMYRPPANGEPSECRVPLLSGLATAAWFVVALLYFHIICRRVHRRLLNYRLSSRLKSFQYTFIVLNCLQVGSTMASSFVDGSYFTLLHHLLAVVVCWVCLVVLIVLPLREALEYPLYASEPSSSSPQSDEFVAVPMELKEKRAFTVPIPHATEKVKDPILSSSVGARISTELLDVKVVEDWGAEDDLKKPDEPEEEDWGAEDDLKKPDEPEEEDWGAEDDLKKPDEPEEEDWGAEDDLKKPEEPEEEDWGAEDDLKKPDEPEEEDWGAEDDAIEQKIARHVAEAAQQSAQVVEKEETKDEMEGKAALLALQEASEAVKEEEKKDALGRTPLHPSFRHRHSEKDEILVHDTPFEQRIEKAILHDIVSDSPSSRQLWRALGEEETPQKKEGTKGPVKQAYVPPPQTGGDFLVDHHAPPPPDLEGELEWGALEDELAALEGEQPTQPEQKEVDEEDYSAADELLAALNADE